MQLLFCFFDWFGWHFCRRLGCGLLCGLCRVLRRELLLHSRCDGVGVHFVDGGILQHLRRLLPGSGEQDGQFNQDAPQRAFLGTAQVCAKRLANGAAVFFALDAALLGYDPQAPLVHQRGKPLRNKQQIALHQSHGDGGGDGGECTNADGSGNRLLATLLLLLRLELCIVRAGAGWLLRVMHGAGRIGAHLVDGAHIAALGDDGVGGELAHLELRALGLFIAREPVHSLTVIHIASPLFLALIGERKTWSIPPYRPGGFRCLPKGRRRRAGTRRAFLQTSPKRLCHELWSEGHLPQHRKAM